MKALCLVLAFLLLASIGCGFRNFTKQDWTLLTAYTAVHIADWRQTYQIADDDAEGNPILGSSPSSNAINWYMGTTLISHWIISYFLKDNYRTAFLAGSTGVESSTVYWNKRRGRSWSY